jgi:hypothetical protein
MTDADFFFCKALRQFARAIAAAKPAPLDKVKKKLM